MAKKKFERTKPHVNIGTIGHVDSWKYYPYGGDYKTFAEKRIGRIPTLLNSIDNAPEEKERGVTINVAHVEYETAKKH